MTGCLETSRQVPQRFVSAIVGEVGVKIKVSVGRVFISMFDLYVFMLKLLTCATTQAGACVCLSTSTYV